MSTVTGKRKAATILPMKETENCKKRKTTQCYMCTFKEKFYEKEEWLEDREIPVNFEPGPPEGKWECIGCSNRTFDEKTINLLDKVFIDQKIDILLFNLTQEFVYVGSSTEADALTMKVISDCKDYNNYSQKFILKRLLHHY